MAATKSTDSSSATASRPIATPFTFTALSYGRVFLGSALALAPGFLCNALAIPIAPYTTTFIRLVGIRDAVMGEHLWFANRARTGGAASAPGGQAYPGNGEVRRDIMAHMAVDGLETALLALLYAKGGVIGGRLALVGGVGSAAFVGLGAMALRSI